MSDPHGPADRSRTALIALLLSGCASSSTGLPVAHDMAALPCGDAACGAGEICIQGECAGCCDVAPRCIPVPAGCSGTLGCDCFEKNPCTCTTCASVGADGIHCENCLCACAAPWTPIATPQGEARLDALHEGDLVYSIDNGVLRAVPIERTQRRPVSSHAVVRVTLSSGRVLDISGSHPTGDGRAFDTLTPGDWLGSAQVRAVQTVPYDLPFTFDLLPASDTGSYFAAGAWIGTTMQRGRP